MLRQCADNKIYLILDLHAAPGGQSANNISDYNPTYLSLWESDNNKTMTIDLWKKLAERYKNETWIGGYDILNEPAWNLGTNNIPLKIYMWQLQMQFVRWIQRILFLSRGIGTLRIFLV